MKKIINILCLLCLMIYPAMAFAQHPGSWSWGGNISSYSDVVALWSSCTTGYLKYDGTCSTGAGDMLSTNNLSDVATKATARINLGVAIGSDVQANSAKTTAIANLANATGALMNDGTGVFSYANFYSIGADGTYGLSLNNNTSTFAPAATYIYGFSFIGGLPYAYFGSANHELATLGGSETLTNKILTSPMIQGMEIIASQSVTLVATQVNGSRINNFGQTGAVIATLPTAAAGMDTVFTFGTATPATYSVQVASGNYFYYNGATSVGVRNASSHVGDYFVLYSFKTGSATWNWILKNGQGTIATY